METTETMAMNTDDLKEFLIFTVNSIDFGIELGLVQEIIKMQPISPIPNAMNFCKGIINIRGTIVPVVDMRCKLGFPEQEYCERTCIIVVSLEAELIGIVVDMVQEVIRIAEKDLTDSPDLNRGDASYTTKIISLDGKVKQILDINSVFQVNI
jgi:purine-binding chemotaxis protein CheW